MSKRRVTLLIVASILMGQLIVFYDYLFPVHWGSMKVSGLACTCPDETVVNGQLYLRAITPDSLRKYNIDYSEIYVTEKPFTNVDLMGVDDYIITGTVIGKDRVSEHDPWNLKIKVESWREVDLIIDFIVKALFFMQLCILLTVFWKMRKMT